MNEKILLRFESDANLDLEQHVQVICTHGNNPHFRMSHSGHIIDSNAKDGLGGSRQLADKGVIARAAWRGHADDIH